MTFYNKTDLPTLVSLPRLVEIQQQQQQRTVCSYSDRDLSNVHRNDRSFKQPLHEKLHIKSVRLDDFKTM